MSTLANKVLTAARPPVAAATMTAAKPGIQPIRITPQKGKANGSSPRASRTLGISSSQVSPSVRTSKAAIGGRRIRPSGPAAGASNGWGPRTGVAVRLDMGITSWEIEHPVRSVRRPSGWCAQHPSAARGRRGCAHPSWLGRAPPAIGGRHPCRVVPAPFQLPSDATMLEATDMPHAQPTVRVLIVDDQAAFRRAACSVVELTPGFVVVGEAETGEGSIDAARAMQPDLVLMDVHLPGIDGLEASRRMLATSGH